jgi:hypothetical protein
MTAQCVQRRGDVRVVGLVAVKPSRSPESSTTTAPCRIAPDAKPEHYRGASNNKYYFN